MKNDEREELNKHKQHFNCAEVYITVMWHRGLLRLTKPYESEMDADNIMHDGR